MPGVMLLRLAKVIITMKCRLIVLAGCSWLLGVSAPCSAKEWRNITPLKTTRAEVLQLLGSPQHSKQDGGEYFDFQGKTVTVRWVRPDCSGKDSFLDGKSVGPDALVYQITVTPEVPFPAPPIEADALQEVNKRSVEPVYKSWVSKDVDCLSGGGGITQCSITDWERGVGYSKGKGGVTALYYFPSEGEHKDWAEKQQPCTNLEIQEQRV